MSKRRGTPTAALRLHLLASPHHPRGSELPQQPRYPRTPRRRRGSPPALPPVRSSTTADDELLHLHDSPPACSPLAVRSSARIAWPQQPPTPAIASTHGRDLPMAMVSRPTPALTAATQADPCRSFVALAFSSAPSSTTIPRDFDDKLSWEFSVVCLLATATPTFGHHRLAPRRQRRR
jgi:hypothetical protein